MRSSVGGGWVKTQWRFSASWVWVTDYSYIASIVSSVPFHLYIVLACVENTFLAALLTIIIKKNDYVNLRITSFSFFEQGDFSWSRRTTSYYVDFFILFY